MQMKFSRPLALLAVIEYTLLVCIFAACFVQLGEQVLLTDGMAFSLGRLFLLCLSVQAMMFALGLYTWDVGDSGFDILVRFCAAFVLGFTLYGLVVLSVSIFSVPPRVLVVAVFASLPVMLILRFLFVQVMDLAPTKSRVVILGTGKQAAHLHELESKGRASRFRITHFLALEPNEPAVRRDKVCDMPDDFSSYLRRNDVSEVVVALEERRGKLPLDQLIDARLQGARITDYQTFCEQAEGRIDLDALRPSWFFQSSGFRSGAIHDVMKRSIDIVLSLGLLIFALPLLIITAIAIKLESPGGIFYTQERVGLGGRPFVLIKFRSMRNDAENDNAPQWAQQGDARVTRVGKIIRKTRIDEVPQILNVLKGDMSFVGPRPERPYFVQLLSEEIPFYRERHRVRPGITGWAQLNYPYGASVEDAKRKLEYDLYYIKYFSVVFDLAIALQTVRVILWSDGAR